MREIKFRAWDTMFEKMIYDIQNYREEEVDGTYVVHSFDRYLSDSRYIVMQYAGIKDRNKKEIYEGDVLRYPNDDEYCIVFYKSYDSINDPELNDVVNLPTSGFCFKKIKNNMNGGATINYDIRYLGGYDIMGNIYENPRY